MPTAIAIRHVLHEDLDGFEAALTARGFETRYREAPTDDLDTPDLDTADLLVVLGGPIGVYDSGLFPFLNREIALIERRLAAGKLVLGLCLGSQLMAKALGARVYATGRSEIGWSPLHLTLDGKGSCLAGLTPDIGVLHWHGDSFDLPRGAVHLASTPQTENQAFAWGRHGLALQFHFEVTPRGLERWYVGDIYEINHSAGLSVEDLRVQADRYGPAAMTAGRAALDRWLTAAGF